MAHALAATTAEPGGAPDPVAMAVADAISQRRITIPDPDSSAGRQEMLRRMATSKVIDYQLSIYTGCHPWIEVNGFRGVLLDVYVRRESLGLSWATASIHGDPLDLHAVELEYLEEKLGCILGRKARVVFP